MVLKADFDHIWYGTEKCLYLMWSYINLQLISLKENNYIVTLLVSVSEVQSSLVWNNEEEK